MYFLFSVDCCAPYFHWMNGFGLVYELSSVFCVLFCSKVPDSLMYTKKTNRTICCENDRKKSFIILPISFFKLSTSVFFFRNRIKNFQLNLWFFSSWFSSGQVFRLWSFSYLKSSVSQITINDYFTYEMRWDQQIAAIREVIEIHSSRMACTINFDRAIDNRYSSHDQQSD